MVGSIIRAVQHSSRDSQRADLANQLAPLEAEKNRCDFVIQQIEGLILQVQAQG